MLPPQRQRQDRPHLYPCNPCQVAWSPDLGRVCWVCGGPPSSDVRQVWFSSQQSLSSSAYSLEQEVLAAEDERDWGADPCSYRLAEELALESLTL